MCMSCVKQNMFLNDQYNIPSPGTEDDDETLKEESNNNTPAGDGNEFDNNQNNNDSNSRKSDDSNSVSNLEGVTNGIGNDNEAADISNQNDATNGTRSQNDAASDISNQNDAASNINSQNDATNGINSENDATNGSINENDATNGISNQNDATNGSINENDATNGISNQYDATNGSSNENDDSSIIVDSEIKPKSEPRDEPESAPSGEALKSLLTVASETEQWNHISPTASSPVQNDPPVKINKFLLAPTSHFPDLPSDLAIAKKMKRSFSFGGFGVFASGASFGGVTSQELESMFDPVSKKEPSKMSKKQIKEYAQKYKHLKPDKDKKLPWYKDPMEYTQPAHLVTCIAIVYLAFRLFPDSRRSPAEASTLTRLLYVSSISAVFGAQFWMTFVSGLALFFAIPRHMFAKVQSVLFPLYFLTNAALMMVVIVTYTQHRPTHLWDNHEIIQGAILVFDFIVNLGIRLYLAPILTKLITIKIAIESEAGIGTEVGSNHPGVLTRCPHYMRLHKAFRRTHVIIAIGNMASMAGTSFHLYYLATKLCSYNL